MVIFHINHHFPMVFLRFFTKTKRLVIWPSLAVWDFRHFWVIPNWRSKASKALVLEASPGSARPACHKGLLEIRMVPFCWFQSFHSISIHIFIYLPIYISIYLSIYLSISSYLSIYLILSYLILSMCLSFYLSTLFQSNPLQSKRWWSNLI